MRGELNMKKLLIGLIVAAGLLTLTSAAQAQGGKPVPYQEGLHYALIEGAPATTSGPMELVEAFSYMCSHCNTFEPYINAWKKRKPENVEFRRIPVVFGRGSWELYARGYVTAEMLKVPEAAHSAMMDRLWKEKNIMRSMEELADFYSQYGVDKQKFLATSGSFAVETRLMKDQQKIRDYGITGTPSLILNGKYRIAGNAAVPSFDVMLDVVDFLIASESAGTQNSSAAAD
jgi:thiol:disulfide interchange protein DsbA